MTDEVYGSDWTKRRILFLSCSALAVVLLLWWASDVLLPFIVAVILAYVLTPLVALCEARRLPRWAAILLVYFVTISSIYFAVAAIAPRIYDEARAMSKDAPAAARDIVSKWGPAIDQRFMDFLGRERGPNLESTEPLPAFLIQKLADGSYQVSLGAGVSILQEGPKHWRVAPTEPIEPGLGVSNLLYSGIDEGVAYVKRNLLELIRLGQTILTKTTRAVFLVFMTLMVAGYLMHTRDRVLRFFRELVPASSRIGFDRLIHRIDRGLSGVVRGQLVICAVNGVLSAIGFAFFGLKYWPILALIAGMMSIVPIFGSILSSVPAVAIGLTQTPLVALWVLLWIVGIHQIEANLLNPKIIGVAAKLHPVLVVFVLVVGEHTHGLWGALLAVPLLSVCRSIFNHFRFESMPDAPPDSLLLDARAGRTAVR